MRLVKKTVEKQGGLEGGGSVILAVGLNGGTLGRLWRSLEDSGIIGAIWNFYSKVN